MPDKTTSLECIKEYKDEVAKLQVEVDDYAKIVGQLTKENNWIQGNSLTPQGHFLASLTAL